MSKPDNKEPIRRFSDLKAWQSSRLLTKATYQATNTFPASEAYGLTSQMRRAAVSIASNIAEGFKRDSMKDKIHFYVIAEASLTELECQTILAKDLGFIKTSDIKPLVDYCTQTEKLLCGLIRASKERL